MTSHTEWNVWKRLWSIARGFTELTKTLRMNRDQNFRPATFVALGHKTRWVAMLVLQTSFCDEGCAVF